MKGLRLLLAVLLAPLAFYGAVADDAADVARAGTRRNAAQNVSTTRKPVTTSSDKKNIHTQTVSRTTNISKSGTVVRERTNTDNSGRGDTAAQTIERPQPKPPQTLSVRSTSKIQPRTIKTTNTTTRARTATSPTTRTRIPSVDSIARAAKPTATSSITRTANTNRTRTANRSRTATMAGDIMQRDFSKCRTVFYDCMDEFCANKDSLLKRCACSSRINEFDATKKSMAQVEDKLLDFNQRLLTVSMDKEDAQALNQATEGELAFANEDVSESKKMLDEIAKKLNTSFDNSHFDQGLNAISLSLNMDAAFDSVDSWAGASTATKSGTELYSAALPICREMALEVCSSDDLAIAESSYQMAIEQDCNTVKKSYQNQTDRARQQIFESGALLDISRLNTHQKRNADDILTCKKKMLDMLTDATVCGDELGKCLDTTGRYIDPSTGEAFLTTELVNLGSLITRPDTGQTWSKAPGNAPFVSYLQSKKVFLEPAMENCQDISDYVWDAFIEDALSQIKLAQDKKLEDMRQACTTLTTQCLDETMESISNFDSRALSIFGVQADKTVNAMCADVRNACTALLNTSGGGENWETGMTAIANQKTYENIISTCREVGRACIIQVCTSTSGNFGLCENINTSINRKSIINRTACWDQVVQCVANAGATSLAEIQKLHPLEQILPIAAATAASQDGDTTTITEIIPQYAFYPSMYKIDQISTAITSDYMISSAILTKDAGQLTKKCTDNNNSNCVHDICERECGDRTDSTASQDCYTCRLAERIWGNCEAPSTTPLSSVTSHNKIKIPYGADGKSDDTGTLLAWFAKNTGTQDKNDNCRDTSCGPGFATNSAGVCVPADTITASGEECPVTEQFNVTDALNNCCTATKDNKPIQDTFGNCCQTGQTKFAFFGKAHYFGPTRYITGKEICTNDTSITPTFIASYEQNGTTHNILCLGNVNWGDTTANDADDTDGYPNGKTVECDGTLISITGNGAYYGGAISSYITNSYDTCSYNGNTWQQLTDGTECDAPDNSSITF